MRALIYTKDDCPYCVKAKNLLKEHDILAIERKLDVDYTRDTLMSKLVAENVNVTRLSVPQIWLNGEYVGGFDRLEQFFESADGDEQT
jgi:glutaredoxin